MATEAHQVPWLREAAEHGDGRFLDESAVRAEVASPTYLGGLFDPAHLRDRRSRPVGASSSRGSAPRRACRSSSTPPPSRSSTTVARVRVATSRGSITAERAVLATNVFPSLLRRNRLHTVPVYDYVLATEPLTDAQLDRIGWRSRQGSATAPTSSTTTGCRPTTGSSGADTTRCTTTAGGSTRCTRTGLETFRRLAAHFFITFPQLDDVRFTHRWAGAIDTNTRFCAHWGRGRARPDRLRQRVHRAGGGCRPVRRRRLPGSARRAPDRTHRAGDGAQEAAAVPARTVGQYRHPGDPLVTGPGRPQRRTSATCSSETLDRLGLGFDS